MTDQDPTQRYEPPAQDTPAGADLAGAGAPSAGEAPAAPPPPVPAIEPVAPTAVEQTTTARPGRSRLKWLVAALVTLLVVGTVAGAGLLLTGDSGDPDVLAWTPSDSVAYAELRLDLPGTQSAELAEVMKAFPGFQDQAAFPVKLSEALDQLVGQATDGMQGYKNDIEPWFGGQVGASVGPLPQTADPAGARALVLLSVKDGAKATAWADDLVKTEGGASATETYGGTTITTVTPPAGSGGETKDMKAAYAVVGPVLALGDLASVKAAIDTGGTSGLSTDPQFQEAAASVTGDRLGFVYLDTAAIAGGAMSLAGDAAADLPELPAMLQDAVPPWTVAAIRAQDGAFIVDTRSPHSKTAGPPQNVESKIPGLVPPTTVVLFEGQDVGKTISELKQQLASDPQLADAVKQIDEVLALVGGFDAVAGWMGEAGVALTRDGDQVSGGLVVVPTDAAAASQLLDQLKGFLQLGGSAAGITVTDEEYAGATITIVNLGGIGGLLGAATEGAVEAPEDLSIAYAVTDEVVVLGYGSDFVKGVLDARAGDSLAKTERFSTALAKADASSAALAWIDVAGVRGFVEGMVPAGDRADYDANAKPYLEAFDSIIGTMAPGETIDNGTIVISMTGD